MSLGSCSLRVGDLVDLYLHQLEICVCMLAGIDTGEASAEKEDPEVRKEEPEEAVEVDEEEEGVLDESEDESEQEVEEGGTEVEEVPEVEREEAVGVKAGLLYAICPEISISLLHLPPGTALSCCFFPGYTSEHGEVCPKKC